jgi:integrase
MSAVNWKGTRSTRRLSGLGNRIRRGELLALQWGDVDLDGGTIRVQRSVEHQSWAAYQAA